MRDEALRTSAGEARKFWHLADDWVHLVTARRIEIAEKSGKFSHL